MGSDLQVVAGLHTVLNLEHLRVSTIWGHTCLERKKNSEGLLAYRGLAALLRDHAFFFFFFFFFFGFLKSWFFFFFFCFGSKSPESVFALIRSSEALKT